MSWMKIWMMSVYSCRAAMYASSREQEFSNRPSTSWVSKTRYTQNRRAVRPEQIRQAMGFFQKIITMPITNTTMQMTARQGPQPVRSLLVKSKIGDIVTGIGSEGKHNHSGDSCGSQHNTRVGLRTNYTHKQTLHDHKHSKQRQCILPDPLITEPNSQ